MSERPNEAVVPVNNKSQSSREKELLVEYLRDHEETCPKCGYNLRMLTKPRCPECGNELTLSVGTIKQKAGSWIALSAAINTCAGLGILWTPLLIIYGIPSALPKILFLPVFFHVLMIPVALFLMVAKNEFLKLETTLKTTISSIGIILCAGSILLFVLVILL